jgi:hypothetical protein
MRSHRPLIIAFVVSLLITLAIACGTSTVEPPNDGGACVPGQQINCGCPGGVDGTQVCKDDGRGYGICVCPDAGLDATDDSPVDAPGDAPPQGCSESDSGPGGALSWAKNFGTTGAAEPHGVAIDPSTGDVVVVGDFWGSLDFGGGLTLSHGAVGVGYDVFVARYDKTGAYKWAKTFGNGQANTAVGVAIDSTGSVAVGGVLRGSLNFGGGVLSSLGDADVFLAELDAGGKHKWSKSFGVAMQDQNIDSVAIDASNNVLIAGIARGGLSLGGGALTGFFIGKFDATGTHLWSKGFGASIGASSPVLALDRIGNPVLAGSFATTVDFGGGVLNAMSGSSAFIAKFNGAGTYQWAKSYGGGTDASNVATDACGNLYVTGNFFGPIDFGGGASLMASDSGNSYVFLAKVDSAGTGIWAKSFVGSHVDALSARGLTVDPSGKPTIACTLFSGSTDFGGGALASIPGDYSIAIASFDVNGAYRWAHASGLPSTGTSSFAYPNGLAANGATVILAGEFGRCTGSCVTSPPGTTLVLAGKTLTAVSVYDLFLASFAP